MRSLITIRRVLFKAIEFIALSAITIIVSPLVLLVWLLDVLENTKTP